MVENILGSQSAESALRLIVPDDEPLTVSESVHRIRTIYSLDFAPVMLGIKLRPLERIPLTPEELLRAYLLSYVTMRNEPTGIPPIDGIFSRHARAYFTRATVDNPLFFWDEWDTMQVVKRCKDDLLHKLRRYQSSIPGSMKYLYAEIIQDRKQLMKLCQAADLFSYKLTDLLEAFELVSPEEVQRHIAEVDEAQENMCLVYEAQDEDIL